MQLTTEIEDNLFDTAMKAAEFSYSPYSHFRVGAAILCGDGSVVTGVNVENRSYGLTNCAERSAIFGAVSSGKRNFLAIAIATPDADYPVSPCGACRQVLSEFFAADAPIQFGNRKDNRKATTIAELFPFDALHELSR
ncbi:MAG: cytidine deaminase [Spirochaetaceae bacterium]|nr:cytidine deaminase [Spirochaetaceae bacterium]